MLHTTKAILTRLSATAITTEDDIIEQLKRDGIVIVTGAFSREHIKQVQQDLAPHFDVDVPDESGFFPTTTQRVNGLFGISRSCVDIAMHPLYLSVANRLLTSTYTFYRGPEKLTAVSKPIISSTTAYRVNPGSRQQALHRDDEDFHARPCDRPMMIGFMTALTRTHKENGATVVIPGSHLWQDDDRIPLPEEAVPAELQPGDTVIFLGDVYHAGGQNSTKDEPRETIGIFLAKAFYRQAENEYLMVPPDRCKALKLTPTELRVLGYGISQPSCGTVDYKDPMESVFGIIDDETVRM